MNEFITWDMLSDFVKLTSIVFAATQFTKNLPIVGKIRTQYWSWIIAVFIITLTHFNMNNFAWMDLLLYGLSAMFISTSASGMYDVGSKIVKDPNEAKTKEPTILNEKDNNK